MLTTSEIIKKYKFSTKKSLGQNFLINSNLNSKIVGYAGLIQNSNILEIGSGIGSLTRAILDKKPKKLVTIDTDQRCIDILNLEIKPFFDNLIIIKEDALLLDEKTIFNEKFKIIANLPYNIGTNLLLKFIKNSISKIDNITVLLQKEVIDRIIAKPKTKNFSRLSVICQYICEVKKCFDVSPSAFYPRPKITSSVISLKPKSNIDYDILNELFKITSILFSKRRKTIKNNLDGLINSSYLTEQGIDVNLRADQLNIEDFIKMSLIFKKENKKVSFLETKKFRKNS